MACGLLIYIVWVVCVFEVGFSTLADVCLSDLGCPKLIRFLSCKDIFLLRVSRMFCILEASDGIRFQFGFEQMTCCGLSC